MQRDIIIRSKTGTKSTIEFWDNKEWAILAINDIRIELSEFKEIIKKWEELLYI